MRRKLLIVALACGWAVPLLALQDPDLRATLVRLERSLQHLSPLEERARQGDAGVIAEMLACTEGPLNDPQAAEERLVSLRHEVSQLQAELDERAAGPRAPAQPAGAVSAPLPPTAGLDDAQRRALALQPKPVPTPAAPAAEPKVAFETPEYSADAVRLARVHYRQGLYREGLALLDGREADPSAAYWKARCLEKLGSLAEARTLYERLATSGGESFEAQRAREDLQFLAWRERFDARRGDKR